MNRLKTYDATGVATGGRLYAGDLNALQDAVAALTDNTQTIKLGTLIIHDDDIQLIKYGSGEARLTCALRVDSILRGLGGIIAGAFTTTARNAISTPPYGLVILNTTTNRYEYNAGSSGSPSWQPLHSATGLVNADIATAAAIAVAKLAPGSNGQFITTAAGVVAWGSVPGGIPIGTPLVWPGPESTIPTNTLLCDGSQYDRTAYPALYAALGGTGSAIPWDTFGGLSAPSAGKFRVPDFRGVSLAGKKDMGAGPTLPASRMAQTGMNTLAALVGEETHVLVTGEMPSHSHGGATGTESATHTHSGTTGTQSADHTHSGTTGGRSADHIHGFAAGVLALFGSASLGYTDTAPNNAGSIGLDELDSTNAEGTDHTHNFTSSGVSANHTHTITTGSESATHTHSVSAQGSGTAHQNVHPVAIVNWIIQAL